MTDQMPGGEDIILSGDKPKTYCSICNSEITGGRCETCGLRVREEE